LPYNYFIQVNYASLLSFCSTVQGLTFYISSVYIENLAKVLW
jgi:hypothetical protein